MTCLVARCTVLAVVLITLLGWPPPWFWWALGVALVLLAYVCIWSMCVVSAASDRAMEAAERTHMSRLDGDCR